MGTFESLTNEQRKEFIEKESGTDEYRPGKTSEFWTEAWIRRLAPKYWVRTLGADEVKVRIYNIEQSAKKQIKDNGITNDASYRDWETDRKSVV